LKPQNILIGNVDWLFDDTVKIGTYDILLSDFGVSKSLNDSRTRMLHSTTNMKYVGTLAYMAPEIQSQSGRPTDWMKADVYSLAILINEIFTGLIMLLSVFCLLFCLSFFLSSSDNCAYMAHDGTVLS